MNGSRLPPMLRCLSSLAVLLAAILTGASAHAQSFHPVSQAGARVCPAIQGETTPPGFFGPDCVSVDAIDINPQGRTIWVELTLTLPASFVERPEPSGLYVFAIASTDAFLNGIALGSNGQVGFDRASESPGRIDAVFFVPPEAMQIGENRVVLRMASHHSRLHYENPVHAVGMSAYGGASDWAARNYWPALVNLGVFILAIFVFAILALRGQRREAAATLTLFSLFMAVQLLAETSRGLFGYAYPLHDIRLFSVVGLASLSSMMVFAYTLKRFSGLSAIFRWSLVAVIALVTGVVIILTPSYDLKALLGIFVPIAFATLGLMMWTIRRKPTAWMFLIGGLATIASIYHFENAFLDTHVFYAGSIFLILLFFEQAQMLIRARRQIATTSAHAERLEMALQQAQQKEDPAELQLTSAGKVERIATDRIAHLAAAGDYVEIHFGEGQTGLYTASLNELEGKLPDTFLRVHRSHIVNTAFVITLTRDANGVGTLTLSTGASVPVSRRIMPRVRSVLRSES